MIYHNPGYCMGNRSRREKFLVALGILANPWMLLLDKLGLAKHPTYQTRTGMSFQTRGQTTDINDAVVVLSGKEYPPELMGLEDSKQQYNGRPRVVLDCGGHIGTFSMYVKSHWPHTKIFAMEPVPDNQKLFKKNIARNQLQDVVMIPYALYGESGTFYIDLAGKQYDAVHIASERPGHDQFIEINALTLDQVITDNNIPLIDLMKLDVEGAEYHIFRHSRETLKKNVQRIIMEFHPAGDKAKRDELVGSLVADNAFELIYETKNILGFDNLQLEK